MLLHLPFLLASLDPPWTKLFLAILTAGIVWAWLSRSLKKTRAGKRQAFVEKSLPPSPPPLAPPEPPPLPRSTTKPLWQPDPVVIEAARAGLAKILAERAEAEKLEAAQRENPRSTETPAIAKAARPSRDSFPVVTVTPPPMPAAAIPHERIPARPIEVISAIRPPRGKKIQWLPPGEALEVAGRQLPGMIYVTSSPQGWEGEPSAVCISQRVAAASTGAEDPPYFPNYESLSTDQRAGYLDWLARGRRDANPATLPGGYLFLFFYGIERRMLIEGDRDTRLWNEIFELLRIYGDLPQNRTLISYFGDFLHFTAYSWGQDSYALALPALLHLQGKTLSETALTLALASIYQRGIPLGWELAHLVAMNLENSRRSVVVERTGEMFRRMFQQRYEKTYPCGIVLKASKRQTTVRYRCGNQRLSTNYDPDRSSPATTATVPGIMGIMSQFKGLPDIWNQCIEDLSGYSRATARLAGAKSVSTQDRLKAYLALPEEMQKAHVHPLAETLSQLLKDCPQEGSIRFVPVSVLAALIGIPERATLTPGQSLDVANLLESMNFTLAPHPRLLNLPLAWSQEIAVCPCLKAVTDERLLGGLLRLLFLAILVASSDGEIDRRELAVFHRSSGATDDYQRTQISATEAVLVRDTHVATKLLPRLAKSVPNSERADVFRLLVHIAGSDEVISSDENRLLRKIAKAFDLEDNALDDLLKEDAALQTVIVRRGRSATGGKPGDERETPPAVAGFSLDMDRIAALTRETAEVVSILSKALAEEEEVAHEDHPPSGAEPEEEEEEAAAPIDAPPSPATNILPIAAETVPAWLLSLDVRYRKALLEILAATSDAPLDLSPFVASHHLMMDDFVDGINSWSDEMLGDFLLEPSGDNGHCNIHLDLIPSS